MIHALLLLTASLTWPVVLPLAAFYLCWMAAFDAKR